MEAVYIVVEYLAREKSNKQRQLKPEDLNICKHSIVCNTIICL